MTRASTNPKASYPIELYRLTDGKPAIERSYDTNQKYLFWGMLSDQVRCAETGHHDTETAEFQVTIRLADFLTKRRR